jgi:hypothetical protein
VRTGSRRMRDGRDGAAGCCCSSTVFLVSFDYLSTPPLYTGLVSVGLASEPPSARA